MDQKKEAFNIQLPRFDGFDIFNILLWVVLLVPAMQLTNNSTFTFLRAILFVIWVAVFFVYVAVRVYREKRILFYSATAGNVVVGLLGLSVLLSLIFSASQIDSLYGYDLTFASSALVLIAVVAFYFVLKLAGLSLEYAVSRVLSSLPLTLVIVDVLSMLAFLIPASVYNSMLGGYSGYFAYLTTNPFALLGSLQQSAVVHLVALVIGGWQLAPALQKGVKKLSAEAIRKLVAQVFLTLVASYLVFAVVKFTLFGAIVAGACLLVFAVILYLNKSTTTAHFAGILLGTILLGSILGVIWQNQKVIGSAAINSIDSATTSSIITQSFLNTSTPMWRQVLGFGAGTFPYLYMQYRPISAVKDFGDASYFYKPSSFLSEVFVEHGGLGILAIVAIFAVIAWSFYKASSQKSLVLEISLLLLLVGVLLVMPSSLAIIVIFFAVIASYFDKVESLPELLPAIRALDIKESLYTNRSISRTNQLLVAAAIISLVGAVFAVTPISMTMYGLSAASQRLIAAQAKTTTDTKTAVTMYSEGFSMAGQTQQYCANCVALSYLKLSALLGIQSIYLNSIPEKDRAASSELRQIQNLLLQGTTELLAKESNRYDIWFAIAQTYSSFAAQEKATSFYVLAVQSMKNTLTLNPFSIDANFAYVNLLFNLGNTPEINTEIQARVNTLKQLVGTPIQIAFIEASLLARNQKYAEAIAAFEQIKKEINASTSLTEADKKALLGVADQRIAEVKKAQQDAQAPKPKPTVTATPTPTPTTSVSATPRPTTSATPTPTPTVTP